MGDCNALSLAVSLVQCDSIVSESKMGKIFRAKGLFTAFLLIAALVAVWLNFRQKHYTPFIKVCVYYVDKSERIGFVVDEELIASDVKGGLNRDLVRERIKGKRLVVVYDSNIIEISDLNLAHSFVRSASDRKDELYVNTSGSGFYDKDMDGKHLVSRGAEDLDLYRIENGEPMTLGEMLSKVKDFGWRQIIYIDENHSGLSDGLEALKKLKLEVLFATQNFDIDKRSNLPPPTDENGEPLDPFSR